MRLLLLLSGPVAVGKTRIANTLIGSHDFQSIKSSAYLRSQAALQQLETNRTNLQQLGDHLDIASDYRWIIDEVALPSIKAAPKQARWLIDSVRKEKQVQHFRERFGDLIWHVHLTAPEKIIEQRYGARLTAGEERGEVDYATAIAHENEISARRLINIADYVVDIEQLRPEKATLTILDELSKRKENAPGSID